jgi:hypothetical protein
MQASQIHPHETYALKVGDLLMRFEVAAVITVNTRTQRKSSPHDYQSRVDGFIPKTDIPSGIVLPLPTHKRSHPKHEYLPFSVKPDQLLGPYQQYVDLKERADQEHAFKKAQNDAYTDRKQAVRLALYELANIAPPSSAEITTQPISTSIWSNITITATGVEALYQTLVTNKKDTT